MADEKMNDKEDEQCKETTSPSNPVPVEEGPVTEAPETDQQPIRTRRSSSPTGEEVEPEGKRARYAGGSPSDSNLDLPDLIKRLMSGIESWLHSHITEYITLPPSITLSIPGVPSNPSRPPKPPKPPKPSKPPKSPKPPKSTKPPKSPKPPKPPGSEMVSSSDLDRLQRLEVDADEMKGKIQETTESTEFLIIDVDGVVRRIENLEAEVNKLMGGSDDLQADLVDYKPKTEVKHSSESETTTDDESCSTGGTIRRVPPVDAEMLCAMLRRNIISGPGSTSGKDNQPRKPPAGDGLSASKKGIKKAIMMKSDGSQVETKVVTTSHDELKDDTTSQDTLIDIIMSQDETMEDITSQDKTKDVIISEDEMKDDNTCQDETKDANTSQDEMKDDKASQDEMKDDRT